MRTGFYFYCTTQSTSNLRPTRIHAAAKYVVFQPHPSSSLRPQSVHSRCMPPGRHVCLFFCWLWRPGITVPHLPASFVPHFGSRGSCTICSPPSPFVPLPPSASFLHTFRSPTAAYKVYSTQFWVSPAMPHVPRCLPDACYHFNHRSRRL